MPPFIGIYHVCNLGYRREVALGGPIHALRSIDGMLVTANGVGGWQPTGASQGPLLAKPIMLPLTARSRI